MKNNTLKFFLCVAFLASMLVPWETSALSCVYSVPVIGRVKSLVPSAHDSSGLSMDITLSDPHSFSGDGLHQKGVYSIDKYQNLVSDYLENNVGGLIVVPTEAVEAKGVVSFRIWSEIGNLKPEIGDVLVKGQPGGPCGQGFTIIFNSDGEIKFAVVQAGYEDFSYANTSLVVNPGKEISCKNDSVCKVNTSYSVNGQQFELSTGETKNFSSGPIKWITLNESSNYKVGGKKVFDWGFGSYSRYAIGFNSQTDVVPAQNNPTLPQQNSLLRLLLIRIAELLNRNQ